MIKCIIFDIDDTLYDEIDYYKSGFTVVSRAISEDFSLPAGIIFETLWQIFNSGNRKTIFNAAAEKLGINFDKDYIAKLVNIFRCHKPDITLPSDSKKVLEELKRDYKLGLITDGFLPAQELKVKALGLEKYFDYVLYTELFGRDCWKPSPVCFEKIILKFNIAANQCVYAGDNLEKDFLSPNRMGFKTIRIVRKNRIHFGKASCADGQANYEISSITELPGLLKEINGI